MRGRESDDKVSDVRKVRRKKKTNNGFSKHLPSTELIISVEEHDKY